MTTLQSSLQVMDSEAGISPCHTPSKEVKMYACFKCRWANESCSGVCPRCAGLLKFAPGVPKSRDDHKAWKLLENPPRVHRDPLAEWERELLYGRSRRRG